MKGLFFLNASDLGENVTKVKKLWEDFYPNALDFLLDIAISFVIYMIGKKLIKILLKIVKRAFERAKLDNGAESFLISLIRILAYGLLFISIFHKIFDMETTSIVAILGSAGLAIGLALQGSLSNFAGGVLLLVLKPFRVGDFIVAFGNEGTVTSVDIFYTKILTIDNRVIVFPNGSLSNTNIINVTNEPVRRVDLIIPIGYHDDIKSVKEELFKLSSENEMVLKDRPIDIFVSGFGDDSLDLGLRVWVEKDNFLLLKSKLLEDIKYMFDDKGFTIPFRHMDVTLKKED